MRSHDEHDDCDGSNQNSKGHTDPDPDDPPRSRIQWLRSSRSFAGDLFRGHRWQDRRGKCCTDPPEKQASEKYLLNVLASLFCQPANDADGEEPTGQKKKDRRFFHELRRLVRNWWTGS